MKENPLFYGVFFQEEILIFLVTHISSGQYLQAEIDGGSERDVIEFLVKKDFVGYRSVATNVIYVYPFTTALGDNKGQQERINKIGEELGWYVPNFELMDD